MAERTVVMDHELTYFETTVPAVEVGLREGILEHVMTHYGGDLANANIYKPTIHTLAYLHGHLMAGDARSPIKEARNV